MSGSERTVVMLAGLGLMVIVAEGWAGNFRDWVRASVGAQNHVPAADATATFEPGTGNGTGAVQPGTDVAGPHGTTAYPTF